MGVNCQVTQSFRINYHNNQSDYIGLSHGKDNVLQI